MNYVGKENLNIMCFAKNYNNFIFNWINEPEKTKILDFGAGNGEFCNRFSPDNITAIEIDSELCKLITCNVHQSLEQISEIKFDLIYSLNVLEHIQNDREAVTSFLSMLEPNGIVKILVPAKMELYSNMDSLVGHYRRYEKKELISLLNDAGFLVTKWKYFDFIGYFISLLYKALNLDGEITPKSLIVYDRIIFPISILFDKLTFGKIIGKNLMIEAKKIVN